ncbi:hypothetical protein IT882_12205 [Microbacterium schleiferi]|uniref:Uncharacterized protein n=1 Tax=Microbacterium schleiferi TaxID=69362 RepID=A0A7S8N0H9_9MICO|nr:hypothetical protein IT882_12205 [Microbacterium schleiferi]
MSTTNRSAAITHTISANSRSPGTCTGNVAAAVATMPVPMTDANQFGVMFETIIRGDSSSRKKRRGAPVGAAEVAEAVSGGMVRVFPCVRGGRSALELARNKQRL